MSAIDLKEIMLLQYKEYMEKLFLLSEILDEAIKLSREKNENGEYKNSREKIINAIIEKFSFEFNTSFH